MSFSHYFNPGNDLKSDLREIEFYYTPPGGESRRFCFVTDSGVFSKTQVDEATALLLAQLPVLSVDVLDIGCGYGCIGIVLAKTQNIYVTMSDINNRAVELAQKNAEKNNINADIIKSDGFENISSNFDNIILNPPIHAGKPAIYKIYEEAYNHLNPDGRFFIIIQKKHGALSHKEKLEEIFGKENCFVLYSKKGFFVFEFKKI